MNLTYVMGDCDKREFDAIRRSLTEKLSQQEQIAVSVKEFADDVNVIAKDIATMFQEAQNLPNPPDAHTLNVVYIFGQDADSAYRIKRALNMCEKVRQYFALWTLHMQMIMLVNEWPMPRVDYGKVLSAIPYRPLNYSAATAQKTDENVYNALYILSDKNSKNAYCRNDRADAAALLIYMLLSQTRYLGHGIYSVGIGKLSSTAHEIDEYARHQAACAIRDGKINHSDLSDIRKLCSDCLPGPGMDAKQKIISYLNRQICSNFCYIEGDGVTTDTQSKIENEHFAGEIVDEWEKNLLEKVKTNPFVADAINFFSDENGFIKFVDDLEVSMGMQIASVTIKKKLFSRTNQIIDAYNGYIKIRDEEKKKVLSALTNAFRIRRMGIIGKLRNLERICSNKLAQFECEPESIQAYRAKLGNTATAIDEMLWNKAAFAPEHTRENFIDRDDTWQELIDRCLEQSGLQDYSSNIVRNLAIRDTGAIIGELNGNINDQALRCLASPRGNNFADPIFKRYYVPRDMFKIKQINDLLQQLNNAVQMEEVSSRFYRNVEELAVFRIDEDGESLDKTAAKLTAFIDMPKFEDGENLEDLIIFPEDDIAPVNIPKKTVFEAEAPEQKVEGWQISVGKTERGGYSVFLNWYDRRQTTLHLRIFAPNDTVGKIITINRGDFESNGYQQDITWCVDYGQHRVQLVSRDGGVERELAACEFCGKEHSYVFESEYHEHQLTDDVQLARYDIQLSSVDGSEDGDRDDALFYNIDLVLNDGHKVRMPAPKLKHRKVSWTVYTDCENIHLIAAEKYTWGYKTELIQK